MTEVEDDRAMQNTTRYDSKTGEYTRPIDPSQPVSASADADLLVVVPFASVDLVLAPVAASSTMSDAAPPPPATSDAAKPDAPAVPMDLSEEKKSESSAPAPPPAAPTTGFEHYDKARSLVKLDSNGIPSKADREELVAVVGEMELRLKQLEAEKAKVVQEAKAEAKAEALREAKAAQAEALKEAVAKVQADTQAQLDFQRRVVGDLLATLEQRKQAGEHIVLTGDEEAELKRYASGMQTAEQNSAARLADIVRKAQVQPPAPTSKKLTAIEESMRAWNQKWSVSQTAAPVQASSVQQPQPPVAASASMTPVFDDGRPMARRLMPAVAASACLRPGDKVSQMPDQPDWDNGAGPNFDRTWMQPGPQRELFHFTPGGRGVDTMGFTRSVLFSDATNKAIAHSVAMDPVAASAELADMPNLANVAQALAAAGDAVRNQRLSRAVATSSSTPSVAMMQAHQQLQRAHFAQVRVFA